MKIDCVPLQTLTRSDWLTFVENCDECWLFHHPDLVMPDLPESRSFGVLENGALVGGCILYVNRQGMGKVLGGRVGPAGLALKKGVSKKAIPIIREYLIDQARKSGCHGIQMSLPILAPANRKGSYLDSSLYSMEFTDHLRWGRNTDYVPSFSTVIDLSGEMSQIFGGFTKSVKEKCKKAGKVGFQAHFVTGVADEEGWKEFVTNHSLTLARGGGAPLPASLLGRLKKLVELGLATLLNVYAEGACQASLLLLTYKGAVNYFASGVKPEAYSSGVAAFIHFLGMQEMKRRGFSVYEMGQSFPTLAGTKLHDLGEFKSMFGGEKWPVLAGELIVSDWRYFFLDLLPAHLKAIILRRWRRRSS